MGRSAHFGVRSVLEGRRSRRVDGLSDPRDDLRRSGAAVFRRPLCLAPELTVQDTAVSSSRRGCVSGGSGPIRRAISSFEGRVPSRRKSARSAAGR